MDHFPWFVNIVASSIPEILFTPTSLERTEVLSANSSFSTNAHLKLQFREFLLVHDSFFHLVGAEMGPCGGLGLALRGSQADQVRLGAHMWGARWQLEPKKMF